MVMLPPKWLFILTDLSGNVLGEIMQGADRTVTLPLNRVPTASIRVPLWHYLAGYILDGNCLLKCYRRDQVTGTNTLVFHGPLITAEESGSSEGQVISATATGPFWGLSKRFIGTTVAGWSYATEASPADLGIIARAVLTTTNGEGYSGISLGSLVASTPGFVGPWYMKNVAEAIAELSVGINSFDYEIAPTEPSFPAGGVPQIGVLNIAPVIGQQRPDAIFEYGTARGNVASYNRSVSRENLMNQGIVSVSGFPDGVPAGYTPVLKMNDDASIAAIGLYQDVIPDAGVYDDALRNKLLAAHLQYRSTPRQIVTFTVSSNATPTPFVDYIVGDWIRARAVVRGSVRFDATFRIWGITFKIDQNGNESLDLQLVQEAS